MYVCMYVCTCLVILFGQVLTIKVCGFFDIPNYRDILFCICLYIAETLVGSKMVCYSESHNNIGNICIIIYGPETCSKMAYVHVLKT